MLVKEAQKIVGGLSKPGKMPGPAINLPAWACKTGAKLAKVPGTPCFGCYALKLRYVWPNSIKAMNRRLAALANPQWVQAMTTLVKRARWFRWHDSGDVQSSDHMNNILTVAKNSPNTKHWMPTQERQFLPDRAAVPDNMIIRLSSSKVDAGPSQAWPWTSSVTTDPAQVTCPASKQGNKCRDCRACWDRDVAHIVYPKH
tara:strand:+ start:206 stop:805 length:600 start_codon:yes stop_codon:yes gene_type:complete